MSNQSYDNWNCHKSEAAVNMAILTGGDCAAETGNHEYGLKGPFPEISRRKRRSSDATDAV